MSRRLFRMLYDRAKSADDLPWHRTEPPALLVEAVAARQTPPGRALDIGCGSGVFSVWLAERGYDVTAIDFTPAALEMARDRAQKAGADITFHEVDVTTPWEASAPFDVVVDSGCLHCFGAPAPRAAYRANVLSWLAPNGDYLLGHFLKRHALDWRPIGPHRFRPERITALFAPDLEQQRQHQATVLRLPLPIGPKIMAGEFWFRRTGSARSRSSGGGRSSG